jgi:3-oxoacyl-[acyl-carrier protein] reductase
MLTRHLAVDLAPHGVRINCTPSAIETERLIELMPAPAREQLGQSFPLRRIGTVDDVADTALFLATRQSSWITGVTIDLTGGRVSASSRRAPGHPYGASTTFRALRRSNSS